MTKLHIVTVATSDEFYFKYLVKSCHANGTELKVLGWGEKFEGFNWKYIKMIEYLQTINSNNIVCFVDGYDVICTRNLNELNSEFEKIKKITNSKIIVSHGNNLNETLMTFYFGKCNDKLLNSGIYIGNAGDLLEILKEINQLNSDSDADDQVLLTNYCKMYPKKIYVDIDNDLFLSMSRPLQEISDFVTVDQNVVSYNDKNPFFVHAQGGGYLDKLIINLGYDYDYAKPINKKIFRKVIEKIPYYTYRLIIDNIHVFFIIILIIIIFYSKN